MKAGTILVGLLVGFFSSARCAGAAAYTVTDLGRLYPLAINSSAQVCGYVQNAFYCPAAWQKGSLVELEIPERGGYANAVNNSGVIAGWSSAGAVTWNFAGQATVLPLRPGAYNPEANDVNDQGVIAGYSQYWSDRLAHACCWSNGLMIDLGVPYGSQSTARAVNNQGAILIDSWGAGSLRGSFIYSNGSFMPLPTDMPFLTNYGVHDLNDAGMVVGGGFVPGGVQRGYVWQDGVTTLLPTPPGRDRPVPLTLNNSGVVVGYAWDSAYRTPARACIWDCGQVNYLDDLVDTNDGWRFEYAHGINDAGQIVGDGLLNGVRHGFLLTPVANTWFKRGRVLCDANANGEVDAGDANVPGVLVVVTNLSGTFSNASWTTDQGMFSVELAAGPDTYVDFILQSTLPQGTTQVLPAFNMFATAAWQTAVTNDFLIENPGCRPQTNCSCRLTGGGTVKAGKGKPLYSFGGVVHPAHGRAALRSHWNVVDHVNRLHFKAQHIEVVQCGEVQGLAPGSRRPGHFIEFQGAGTLTGLGRNQAHYGLVSFFARAEDRGEPGAGADRLYLRVFDGSDTTLLLLGGSSTAVVPVPLSTGNLWIKARTTR